jgi:hypothetical protein
VMLIRGPAGAASFGTVCSHSCWQAPPITTRSPWPGGAPGPAGRRPAGAGTVAGHPATPWRPAGCGGCAGSGRRARHAVPAVAVEVDPDPVEDDVVVPGQGRRQVPQRCGDVVAGDLGGPAGGQPRLRHGAVPDLHGALAEPTGAVQQREQLVRPAQPAGRVVDPRALVQGDPAQAREPVVDRRLAAVEQRPCRPTSVTTSPYVGGPTTRPRRGQAASPAAASR